MVFFGWFLIAVAAMAIHNNDWNKAFVFAIIGVGILIFH